MSAVKPLCKLKSLSQAAEELGITVNTLRAWIYRRKIGYTKIGRCVRVSDETIKGSSNVAAFRHLRGAKRQCPER